MPRQIGWSQESNLLYNISMQLDRLAAVTAASGGGGGGGTITGGGAAGQVTFWDAATNITGSNNLFWTGTNLGIGTNTPSQKLVVVGNTFTGAILGVGHATSSAGEIQFFNGNVFIRRTGASGLEFATGSSSVAQTIFSTGNIGIGTATDVAGQRLQVVGGETLLKGNTADNTAFALTVQNNSSTNLFRVRNDGNVGIGVTISDWGSTVKALQIGSISGIALIGYNQGAEMGQNVYYTTTYKYATAAAASIYVQNSGRHYWRTASSGTANANLTFTTAMTLDEFGKLGIMNTPTAYLDTAASTTTAASLRIRSGVAPTTPNDGDIWATSTDLLARVSNNTYSLIGIITANRQTVNYSLVLADNGKLVEMNVGAANTLTVPPNSSITFPIGTKIDIAQYGAGQTSIVPGAGVTVRSALGALKLAAQYSGASLVKIGTDEWYLFGDITV